MTTIKNKLIIAAAACVLAACSAANANITKDFASAPAGASILDFDNPAPAGITVSGGQVVSGTTGTYAAPWDASLGAPDPKNYLTTGIGTVTIDLAPTKYFGLLWGSIDSYNTLTLYDNQNAPYVFSGDSIKFQNDGYQLAGGSVYVSFYSSYPIIKAELSSSQYAFEVDNITFTPVPEPSTLIAGAILLLPFGMQTVRSLRSRKP